ncbi:MAG: hypothetical protein RJA22_2883 [Verrucomicrobiota bacterium]|jgi:pSer/pThr/pTyr-binding forkhead associated (FHA) protein
MPRLVLLSEGYTGRTYELTVEKTTVGRVSDNALEIPEASVSSHHAEIVLRGSEVHVRDLDSTNGTFIDGQRLTGEGLLKPGQILRLGTIDLRLESGEPAGKAKQTFDKTRVIPQGVKAEELEGRGGTITLQNSGFERRGGGGAKIFVILAIVIGVALLGALVWVLFLKS